MLRTTAFSAQNLNNLHSDSWHANRKRNAHNVTETQFKSLKAIVKAKTCFFLLLDLYAIIVLTSRAVKCISRLTYLKHCNNRTRALSYHNSRHEGCYYRLLPISSFTDLKSRGPGVCVCEGAKTLSTIQTMATYSTSSGQSQDSQLNLQAREPLQRILPSLHSILEILQVL